MYFCFKIHFALLEHERRLLEILLSVGSLVLQETRWRCTRSNTSSPLFPVEQFEPITAILNRFKFQNKYALESSECLAHQRLIAILEFFFHPAEVLDTKGETFNVSRRSDGKLSLKLVPIR